MKRYLLIAGGTYYPSEGTDDWIDSFDTKAEAYGEIETVEHSDGYIEHWIRGRDYGWYEVVDLETWTPPQKDGG